MFRWVTNKRTKRVRSTFFPLANPYKFIHTDHLYSVIKHVSPGVSDPSQNDPAPPTLLTECFDENDANHALTPREFLYTQNSLRRYHVVFFPWVRHPCVLIYDAYCVVSICYPSSHSSWAFSMLCPQYKNQEMERVEKWLKMVKNWNRYHNNDKVSASKSPSPWPQIIDPYRMILI